jgi:hypothetical protein
VASHTVAVQAEVQGLRGLAGASVKFGKGLKRRDIGLILLRPMQVVRMRRVVAPLFLLLISAVSLPAQKTVFENVKIRRHRSAEKRVLVDKIGVLTLDDANRKLTFKSDAGDNIEVRYDDIQKVVFDVATHMRGGGLAQVIQAAPLAGPIVGTAIAGAHVNDYRLYFQYKDHDQNQSVLLVVPKNHSAQIIDKTTGALGSRVTVADFPEKGVAVKKDDLKAVKSKQELRIDKQNHPLPEVRSDKATVVVVCPPLAARDAGKGNQFKLHANDQVVAVNRMGTYSFAHLDPGKYRLVSQAEDANGFEMELEAGHEYFFLQNTFQGVFRWETTLSRNSREVVTYLAEGSYLSDWKPREK